jgi:hypothetical protein
MKKNKSKIEITGILDKSASNINKPNIFSSNNLSKKNKNNEKKIKKYNWRKARKITIKKYCANYKNDFLGKQNKSLYEACKINQYCRKNKCKDIDRKFDKIKNNKLGKGGIALLLTSITNKCPLDLPNKTKKKCLNKATKKFYEDNGLSDIYNKVLECDKKTCSRERQIFFTNLFRANKTKKRFTMQAQVKLEDIPDQQMIESN